MYSPSFLGESSFRGSPSPPPPAGGVPTYNMPGGKEKQGRSIKWQKKRQAPATLQNPWKNVVSAKMGLAEKNIKLTEDQKPWKNIGKTTLWGRSNKWQKKRQAPGRHGNGRGPSKSLGKTKGSCRSAAGNGVACWGPPGKSYGRWKTLKTIGKTTFWAHTTTWQEKRQAMACPASTSRHVNYCPQTPASCKIESGKSNAKSEKCKVEFANEKRKVKMQDGLSLP